jgi:hypothetical protein
MKIKKRLLATLGLCMVFFCGFSTIVSAGTLYTGPVKTHSIYSYHLSASANTGQAPKQVASNGYAQSASKIGSISATAYVFNNSGTVIKSGYSGVKTNANFASAHASYAGWPSGATYCWGSINASFQDRAHGNFLGTDTSTKLYK